MIMKKNISEEEFIRQFTSDGPRKLANKLGITERSVYRRRKKLESKRNVKISPPVAKSALGIEPNYGFNMKGVSTLYDENGNIKLEWVKVNAEKEQLEEAFREAVEGLKEEIPRETKVKPPKSTNDTLMACYPVGDHHMGMLSWHEETGDDYDLKISEDLLNGAISHLVKAIQPCEKAAVVFLGDFMHYDSYAPLTPASKNLLDADSRYPKMVRVAVRSMRNAIDVARRQHKNVHVIVEPGNHDPSSSIFLMEILSALYEKEPRVYVDTTPRRFHYFRFGKNLVGTHHGDKKIKMSDLPLIMATDNPEDWGKTKYRYCWTGHVHHDQVKDYQGCKVESMRVLPPTDAYGAESGYRSMRDMKAIVLHKEFGEVARYTVNPDMIKS